MNQDVSDIVQKARGVLKRLFNIESMTIEAICRILFVAGLFFVLKAVCALLLKGLCALKKRLS